MKTWKKIGVGLLVCALGVGAVWADNRLNRAPAYDPAAFASYRGASYAPQAQSRAFDGADAYQTVGETAAARLLYNSARHAFAVEDKAAASRWETAVTGLQTENTDSLGALFSAVIADTNTGNTLTVDNVKDACTVQESGLKGGVQLAFTFPAYELTLTLQVFLDDSGMLCRVPLEGVREGEGYHLVNLDVLPFFGAAGQGDKGYVLYPDGAGALYRFGEGNPPSTTPLTLDVYGPRNLSLDDLEDNRAKRIPNLMLPAFGMKRGEAAFAAVICEGDASAAITLAPSGYVYPLHRVYACAVYRRVTSTKNDAGFDVFHVEEASRGNDFAVKFFFSGGKPAGYSWMAGAIRGHLLDAGLLPESAETEGGAYVELLMGAEKSGMLGASYQTMTTAREAGTILEELRAAGNGLTASLLGWQKEGCGVSPGSLSAAAGVGGKRGLQALSPDGVTLALQLPVVFGGTEKTGAKRRRDAVVNVRGVTLVNEDESAFLLNANTQYRLLEKRLAGFDAFSGKGLLLTGAAELLYEDYNRGSAMTRQETLQALQALMDKAGQAGPLLLPRANAYALPYADFLTEMPEGGSGYALLGESVPFYYLVVSGSIPYALETAGNLSPDLQKTKLKWLEYGAAPYFLLSGESSEKLTDTAAESLFSTGYADQKVSAAAVLQEWAALRESLKGQRLCGHERTGENLAVCTYSGGTRILVNAGDEDARIAGEPVPARSYRVLPG